MGMQTIAWLRRAAIATATTGALWSPLQSVAHADQPPTRQLCNGRRRRKHLGGDAV